MLVVADGGTAYDVCGTVDVGSMGVSIGCWVFFVDALCVGTTRGGGVG